MKKVSSISITINFDEKEKSIKSKDYLLSFSLKGQIKPVYQMYVTLPAKVDTASLFAMSDQAEKYIMSVSKTNPLEELPNNYGVPIFDKEGNLASISTLEYSVLTFNKQKPDPTIFGDNGTWDIQLRTSGNGAGTRRASSQASTKPGLK